MFATRPFFALAVLASATFAADAAVAGDVIHLTPPLYREQARATQQVRHVNDLTTTPQPVAAMQSVDVTGSIKVQAEAAATPAR